MDTLTGMKRTDYCGNFTTEQIGQEVTSNPAPEFSIRALFFSTITEAALWLPASIIGRPQQIPVC